MYLENESLTTEPAVILEDFDHLTSCLYDCAAQESGFVPFLQLCCDYFKSTSGMLYEIEKSSIKPTMGWTHGYPPGLIQMLIKTGAQKKDEAINRAINSLPETAYCFSNNNEQYDINTELSTTSKLWAKAVGISDSAATTFEVTPERRVALILNRHKDHGVYSPSDINMLNLLAPHIKRAFKLYQIGFTQKKLNDSLAITLDSLDLPIMVFSNSAQLISINERMHQLNDDYAFFKQTSSGVQLINEQLDNTLTSWITEFLSPTSNEQDNSAATFLVPTKQEPIRIKVRPLYKKGRQVSAILVEAKDFNRPEIPCIEEVMTVIDATKAEANIVRYLIQGLDAQTISEKSNISIHTVRAHIKAVLAKNNFTKQIELTSTVLHRTL